jgi:uncharacterized protein
MNNAVIIFVKNPVIGKVKTRLSATIGNEKALNIYKKLLAHTLLSVKEIMADVFIYFSNDIEENIFEFENTFFKKVQEGNNLGDRMKNAFDGVFDLWYDNVIIIGTDCPGIDLDLLDNAFLQLDNVDVVVGPAEDGGYYLLGMKKRNPQLFDNINWSTSSVLYSTINCCKENNLAYTMLPTLSDVDEEKDLIHFTHFIK